MKYFLPKLLKIAYVTTQNFFLHFAEFFFSNWPGNKLTTGNSGPILDWSMRFQT